uniref:NADPH:adrenodoxin oxidoreductase, mitochondrial n=1 Tax=Aceria tosichella TaxID=561515 RepID=A0A6G1SC13_9ACAR
MSLLNAARFLSTIKVAIVGSGPAGFYTTQKLIKHPNVNVDIYEKLPVPFGLVRYGVAPDHQDVKNVIKSFTSTISNNHDRVNFYGNVSFGTDIGLDDLIQAYHAVVLCYGSAQDKLLNIDGENSKNTISARNFVGWYNGVPEDKDLGIDLNCDTACIIGHGNVALDCARILLKPSNLDKTDITSYAQQLLAESKIRNIYIIGRRGPIQASFTVKELRELIKLNERATTLEPTTIFEDNSVSLKDLNRLPRHKRRLTELMLNVSANREISSSVAESGIKTVFKFLSKPNRINADPVTGAVNQLELQKTEYKDTSSFMDPQARPDDIDEYEAINCGLVIRSIGYKAVMIDKHLPVDNELGAIMNTDGRIFGYRNLYCSGWLATGASGVIAGTLQSSEVTAKSILDDIQRNELPNLARKKEGFELIDRILASRSIQVVHFNQWLRIDEMERRLGAILGKNREKLVDVTKMLEVARGIDDAKQ